jgi:hypothetical protein
MRAIHFNEPEWTPTGPAPNNFAWRVDFGAAGTS